MLKRSSFVWMFVALAASLEVQGAITSFTASPAAINPGGTSTLSWTTQNATSVTIDHGIGTMPANGSVVVSPTITTTYTLSAGTSSGVPDIATTTVTVIGSTPTAPLITSFTASPKTINVGETSTLSWTTEHAFSVRIDQGVGPQALNGSAVVSPPFTTTYTLSAAGNSPPNAVASTTVTVIPDAPRVVVSSPPRGMVQLPGEGRGTDSFTLTNIGSARAFVSFTQSGNFFDIFAPSSTIDPHSSMTVPIKGIPQNAGAYEGTVTAIGEGADGLVLRVRLLSSAPPTGTVDPQPSQSREQIDAPAGQGASGSAQFTNRGNSAMNGIAVSDVPWMTPQTGVITIGAGQTGSVSYTVDSSKRPDADSPLGAVTGTLSLVFIRGSSTPTVSDGTTADSSQVSVTLVYVVKPGTSQATPPPLAGNEIALFVPGLANRANATGDFLLSNRNTSATLSDVKLYLLSPGAPSQLATLPTLAGGSSALFPGLLKNVFAASAQSGTAQVRTTDTSKISVAGIQSNTSSSAGTFSTSLPVLRSDRGVSNGGVIVLPGVIKDSGVQTNVYIQEVSGAATTVQVDSLNADGAVIASRPTQSLDAFALMEVLDAAPAQAAAARITNLGNGRIGAFALVTNSANGDAWMSTDPGLDTESDGALMIPLFSAGSGAETTVFATNRGSSPITATMEVRGPSKRRAVAKPTGDSALTPVSEATTTLLTLSAQQSLTTKVTSTSPGYIRLTASPGVLSAVARTLRSTPAFGSGLPAIAASSALRSGESKRFAGVDDASPATRSARSPGTFRSSLMLIETANESAVVRVALRYTFAAGDTVSARAVSSREYTVAASQFVMISDFISEVIGAQRATFGDLRNIDVDVDVVSGSGRIIPLLQSIDNGSDDSLVRTD